ncbi:hypothetical protein EHP00_1348 [Ecytonucleospora hepatopenaei]|uniref:Uncharacterized protein n=1 Tax=Ecytonucleospora hepatopenaei TaxID=646526 RepID=A0A1W0E6Y2_9MICR|nr:hypothetical protein EHP00_1348 [Ecytonucleospora hepatopenaei]
MDDICKVYVRDLFDVNTDQNTHTYIFTTDQIKKIKYFKNQMDLFKTQTFDIDCSNELFKEIHFFCTNNDFIDIRVDIQRDAEDTKVEITEKALLFFDKWTPQSMVDICKLLIYIEYPYLLEVACKKLSDLLLETNGTEEIKMY